MVDKSVLAAKISAIRDAVARVRQVLPSSAAAFAADRTASEVVTLNLFRALQESIALATHWVADAGWSAPSTYGAAFAALAERGVLDRDLAARLQSASGLRNLIAHQYGELDLERLFGFATTDLDDLLDFCTALARQAG